MAKKTTTTYTGTSTDNTANTSGSSRTGTTGVNAPDWLLDPAKGIAGGINDLVSQGPEGFGPQVSDAQRAAWQSAQTMPGVDFSKSSDAFGGIQDITAGGVSGGNINGESLLSGLENYYNPFKDQITNPVLSDYDFQADQTRAGQAADAARNKAFQGSRYGIQEAETEGQLARGRAATEGGLLKDMFTESTRLSGEDAGRRQDASTTNANLALQASMANQSANLRAAEANQRLGVDRAKGYGDITAAEQADRFNRLDAQGEYGAQESGFLTDAANYPAEYLKQMGDLYAGLDPSSYFGKTATDDSSGWDTSATTSTKTGTEKTKKTQGLIDWAGDFLTAAAG